MYSLLYQDSEIEDLREIKKNLQYENDLQTNDSLLQGWSHSPDIMPAWNQEVSGAAASIAAFDPRPYGVEYAKPEKEYYDSKRRQWIPIVENQISAFTAEPPDGSGCRLLGYGPAGR